MPNLCRYARFASATPITLQSERSIRLITISLAALAMSGECRAQSSALPPGAIGPFQAFSSQAAISIQLSTVFSSSISSYTAGTNTIAYDPSSASYTLRSEAQPFPYVMFATSAANAKPATTAMTAEYSIPSANYGFTALSLSTGGTTSSGLSYTAYGLYSSSSKGGVGEYGLALVPFVFGQTTPAAATPIGGLAYYHGAVDGDVLYGQTLTRLTNSSGDLLVNFATGQVATGLNLSTASGFFGRLDGRGSIAGGTSQFSGSLFGSGTSYTGFFSGGFFGPSAQEAGFTFAATPSDSSRTVSGVFTGSAATAPSSAPVTPAPIVAGANISLTGTLVSQTFSAFSSRLTRATSSAIATVLANVGDLAIAYDASAGTYAVSSSAGSSTFSAAAMNNNGTIGSIILYRPQVYYAGTVDYVTPTDQLDLFVNSADNSRVSLTYLSYGVWTNKTLGTTYTTFLYGAQTPTAQLPRSGLALYDGVVGGVWTQGSYTYRLDGYSLGSILANFTTGEVRTTMAIAGYDPVYKVNATLGRVDGYGSITAATGVFNGTLGGQGYSGTFQGGFFGPAAQEAGATFALNGPTAKETLSGVIAARQVPLPR